MAILLEAASPFPGNEEVHMKLFVPLLFLTAVSFSAQAQDGQQRSILVLDASGSMWGQIDGEAKISIAQRSVSELLDSLPPQTELGLMAYGHNRRGDCEDIELMVEPGPDTHDRIAEAVNGIRPKGKTPLGDAVLQAAQALRFQEEAASVILLSDGLENCGVDTCALGAQLEADGIAFTAHVIGFDVTAPEDQAQLACLAEQTGGRFLSAENASELSEALIEVASVPEPTPLNVKFLAIEGDGGPRIDSELIWFLTDAERGDLLADGESAVELTRELLPGRYAVEVLRPADEQSAQRELEITPDGPTTVTLVLPVTIPDASLSFAPEAVVGATLAVAWEGPGAPRDYITVSRPDDDGYEAYVYLEEGNPAPLQMPADPGDYEVRYVQNEGRRILARAPLLVGDASASVEVPPTAPVASTVSVGWEGPAEDGDYISVAKPGVDDGAYEGYVYVRDGNPAGLTMPGAPGTYEIRYILSEGPRILASATIEVTDVEATLEAPPTGDVGAELSVSWTGPGNDRDYISVAKPNGDGGAYVNYTYTREGNPVALTLPAEPGRYEVRYILDEGRRILASLPIDVTAAEASLSAPPSAGAGGSIEVGWTGPENDRDYISVAQTGAPDGNYEHYTYVRDGNPVTLQMPADPGRYEIRYILSEGPRILTAVPIEVTAVSASITVPPSADAGALLPVEWTGPDNARDFVTVARPDAADGAYEGYTYTREGNPLELQMPVEPGPYEIRYIQATGKRALARASIRVVDVAAQLEAPERAPAGGSLEVNWTGPDYPRDYISIAQPDAKDGQYEAYRYTRDGQPLSLDLPDAPGQYELRYVLGNGPRVITRRGVVLE